VSKPYWEYKDTCEGTLLIVCNGPSLKDVPQEFLEMYPTFGMNELHHPKGNKKDFWPTYYIMVGLNQLRYEDQRKPVHEFCKHSELAFVNRLMTHYFPYDNVLGLFSDPAAEGRDGRSIWSDDPLCWCGLAFTVTYVALQIAFYLGYRKVLCVGLDNRYDDEAQHFYGDRKDDLRIYDADTLAHGCDYVYALAKKEYEKVGAEIINLTPNSNSMTLPQAATIEEYWK